MGDGSHSGSCSVDGYGNSVEPLGSASVRLQAFKAYNAILTAKKKTPIFPFCPSLSFQ
jgi:hypothetical protein